MCRYEFTMWYEKAKLPDKAKVTKTATPPVIQRCPNTGRPLGIKLPARVNLAGKEQCPGGGCHHLIEVGKAAVALEGERHKHGVSSSADQAQFKVQFAVPTPPKVWLASSVAPEKSQSV